MGNRGRSVSRLKKVDDEELLKSLFSPKPAEEKGAGQGDSTGEVLAEGSPSTPPPSSRLKRVEDDELRKRLFTDAPVSATAPATPATPEAPVTPKREPNYIERMSSLREKRIGEVTDTFEKLASDEIGLFSGVLQTVGKGAFGALMDFTGETVSTGLSAVVPDFVEDPFKDAMVQLFSAAGDTDVIKAAKKEWDALDDNTKKNLESATNVLAVLLPKIKAPLAISGKKVKGAGEAIRKARISDSLKLPKTTTNEIKRAQKVFRDPVGHKQMVDEVSKVKGYRATNSPEKNLLIVDKELTKTEVQLQNMLRTQPKKVTPDDLYPTINKNLEELIANNTWLTSDTTINNALKNNIKSVTKILNRNQMTTEGLLKARREVDNLFNGKGKNKLELPIEELSSRDAITKVMRDSVNEVIDKKYPRGEFKNFMSKEHQLLKARENLAFRFGHETSNLKSALNFVKAHPIAAGLSIQGSGMLVGLLTNPYVTVAALGGGGAFTAYRTLPSTLKYLGEAMEAGAKLPTGVPATRSALFYGQQPEEEVAQPPLPTP